MPGTGGDIRNAVLKAASAAALEPAGSESRVIRAHHLDLATRDVVAGKRVMRQSLFARDRRSEPIASTAWALPLSAAALVVALAALIAALVQ